MPADTLTQRRTITLRGTVQGVGFRPFVYRLAQRLELAGSVRNRAGEVLIDVEGEPRQLDGFLEALQAEPPPLARIESLAWSDEPPRGERQFCIEQSDLHAAGSIAVSPDVATCDQCLAELFDPADRRFRYPFLNCTNCGPRLTIVQAAPYDRERTTMAGFAMCPACRAEYEDPADRRFHAQPTACPICGPRLSLWRPDGKPTMGDPLAAFAAAICRGEIGALKGLGGYHLVSLADDERAVAELRRRKHRDEKPLAIMVQGAAAAQQLCRVSEAERELLESPPRPIVLLRRLAQTTPPIASSVAPGNPYLGVMLPSAPLHHLLLDAVGNVPLVMTSGNLSEEPIAYEDDDARRRLAGIADIFLTHDRPIHVRCDDSVTRVVARQEMPLRRSRGWAPQPVRLPRVCPVPLLAVGGQFKGTFALASEQQAVISHHLGDLDQLAAFQAFERDIALYEQLFEIRPACLVHDLHPDYASARYALRRAEVEQIPAIAVQHHHAHLASCLADNGVTEPAIGVIFDGAGYGTDGAVWGGEFLVGDASRFRRAVHLRYVRLPGGDRAAREPWRMALAHLRGAGCERPSTLADVPPDALRTIEHLVERGLNSPLTSSAGRLFDAVAALAGIRQRGSFEGQAAMELEWLATDAKADGAYPFELQSTVVDTRPLIRAVAADAGRGVSASLIARRFHSTLVEVIAAVCGQIRGETGLGAVALSGGVFQNALLTAETCERLACEEFRVYRHRQVPPNDGGLCLGQAAIAAATMGNRQGE